MKIYVQHDVDADFEPYDAVAVRIYTPVGLHLQTSGEEITLTEESPPSEGEPIPGIPKLSPEADATYQFLKAASGGSLSVIRHSEEELLVEVGINGHRAVIDDQGGITPVGIKSEGNDASDPRTWPEL